MGNILKAMLAVSAIVAVPRSSVCLADAGEPVDFQTDIQPILESRCYQCHSVESSNGKLQLDSRRGALVGGDSGLSVLEPRLESNELFRRITSADSHDRMPRGGTPLSDEQIEVFRRWIEEGAFWPTSRWGRPPDRKWENSWIVRLKNVYVDNIRPHRLLFGGILIGLFVFVEVWKWLARRNHRCTTGRAWFVSAVLRRIQGTTYVFGAGFLCVMMLYYQNASLKYRVDNQEKLLHEYYDHIFTNRVFEQYGNPPVPARPDGPRGIQKVYYRGNCERHPELYNHGNYLTATIRVNLCNIDGQSLPDGKVLDDGQLAVRVEIERAPGTPDSLFSPEIMSNIFLRESPRTVGRADSFGQSASLRTVVEGQKWESVYPLGAFAADGDTTLDGLIYMHRAMGKTNQTHLVYAIGYELPIRNGRLTDKADVWLGSLWTELEIAESEWLSTEPIPEIQGPNTSDPELLGIPEHVSTSARRDQEVR